MPRSTAGKQAPTLADLIDLAERLGGVPPHRVRRKPFPGTATEADLIRALAPKTGLCELVDGTLVDKVPNLRDSALTAWLVYLLYEHSEAAELGFLLGPSCAYQIQPGLVRLPDLSFVARRQLKCGYLPEGPIADLIPALAIEVLSNGNTPGEMRRKREELFDAGTRLVWEVDARSRSVMVYEAPECWRTLTEEDILDGREVLPELHLPVRLIFER